MKRKRIWLINPFAMPPLYEARVQTLKRAYYLMQNEYDVTIVSGSFLHNKELNLIDDNSLYLETMYDDIFHFIHIKNTNYTSNGFMRVLSLLEFHFKLWWLAKKFEKPDYISHLAAVPFGNITYFIAKKLKAHFIVDVVDLWPESFVAYGLASKSNPIIKFSYLTERWLYHKAEAIVFTMEGGKDYIMEKGWEKRRFLNVDLNKVFYINNGVDINDFNSNKWSYTLSDEDLLDSSKFKVVYIGSIRLANNLKSLINAAEYLQKYDVIKFLIYGDGDDREYLMNYCIKNNLKNVVFKSKWVELKYVPFILSKSSLNILNYKPSALFRFGASQSKSFQYMASGRPICSNVKMNYCPIERFNIGIAASFKDSKSYADAILSFYQMEKTQYDDMCARAKIAAQEYDYKVLTDKFISVLQAIR